MRRQKPSTRITSHPQGLTDVAIDNAVTFVMDIFREKEEWAKEMAEKALETKAFVVTEAGDAPVEVSAIVPASMHEELLTAYAASGYTATPVTIKKRDLDNMAAALAFGLAAAGK
jgi:hypothetical protein